MAGQSTPLRPPTMQSSELARWFSQEVQPYEPALRAYLSRRFPSLPDHDDLVQETYARTLRAREAGRLTYTKAFLFTAARNAAIDLLRHNRRSPHQAIANHEALPVADETPGVLATLERQQQLDAMLEAMLGLPERCREVMMLRYLDGMSYREIAGELGISPETVKVHLVKGVRDCTLFFHRCGLLAVTKTADAATP